MMHYSNFLINSLNRATSFKPGLTSNLLLRSTPANIGWRMALMLSTSSTEIPPLRRNGMLPW